MTEKNIIFRPAIINDAKLLLSWRNDPETRKQSINMEEVPLEKHIEWLEKSLTNPNRKLLIAIIGEEPVGTIRLDIEKPYAELSWTVAPTARGRGVGTKIVKEAVQLFNRSLKAKIKPGNLASMKIAESAGFHKVSENSEITEWVRD